MFREQLEGREAEIVRTLSVLTGNFILIGGYAVSALSSHRFSVDCDIVVSKAVAEECRSVLIRERYAKRKAARVGGRYGAVEIYAKRIRGGIVSFDMFIDILRARETGASWTYGYIRRNSTAAIVSGTQNSSNVLAPKRELLIAMKIHSGRDADIRDIVMLSEKVDWSNVARHVIRGDEKILLEKLTRIIKRTEDEQFVSSLRATFELRKNITPLVTGCRKGLSESAELLKRMR